MDDNKNEIKYLLQSFNSTLIYDDVILYVFKTFLKIEINVVST